LWGLRLCGVGAAPLWERRPRRDWHSPRAIGHPKPHRPGGGPPTTSSPKPHRPGGGPPTTSPPKTPSARGRASYNTPRLWELRLCGSGAPAAIGIPLARLATQNPIGPGAGLLQHPHPNPIGPGAGLLQHPCGSGALAAIECPICRHVSPEWLISLAGQAPVPCGLPDTVQI